MSAAARTDSGSVAWVAVRGAEATATGRWEESVDGVKDVIETGVVPQPRRAIAGVGEAASVWRRRMSSLSREVEAVSRSDVMGWGAL
jgi:hypothetical protein